MDFETILKENFSYFWEMRISRDLFRAKFEKEFADYFGKMIVSLPLGMFLTQISTLSTAILNSF